MTIGNQPVNSDVMWGNLSFENSPMKSHIQGLFILLGVAIALLALANIAAPVLGDAFGEDGAIVAESAVDDGADPTVEAAIEVPLDGEEVALLQANLTDLGFDPGPVDGILGNGTRSAINEAIVEYQLEITASDRKVLEYTQSLIDALTAAGLATSLRPGFANLHTAFDGVPASRRAALSASADLVRSATAVTAPCRPSACANLD